MWQREFEQMYANTDTNTRRETKREIHTNLQIRTLSTHAWVRDAVSLIVLAQQHTLMIPIFLSASASDTISLAAGFTSGQGTTRTLSISQRHIRTLYQGVTNWLPPKRSSQLVISDRLKPGNLPKFYPPICSALYWTESYSELRLFHFEFFFHCILLTRFDQLLISFSLCLHSESALKLLNHETITKYKSSLLLLCHSDSPSTLSHLFSLFFPSSFSPSYSLFLSLHLTQTQL